MPRYIPKNMQPIIDELISDNDRAKAIVGGAIVEAALDYAIRARIIDLDDSIEDKIFNYGGAFGTAEQRIDAAHALGLFGPKTRKDLLQIIGIRNEFAHNLNPVSFDDDKIKHKCENIVIASNSDAHNDKEWRLKFCLAIQLVMHSLAEEGNQATNKPTVVNRLLD